MAGYQLEMVTRACCCCGKVRAESGNRVYECRGVKKSRYKEKRVYNRLEFVIKGVS
jgi:hypothetical protein